MKRGVYAGSFDPVTVGHIDLIERAAKLCDELCILVAPNMSKGAMFSFEDRVKMLKDVTADIPNVTVASFEGHLPTFILEHGFDLMFRGLRSNLDFDYEIKLAQLYAKFYNGKVETVYLMTDPRYSYISSSIVRENYMLGADVSGWVADSTLKIMNDIYEK